MRKLIATIGLSVLFAAVLAPAAGAKERLLTLYSPRIDSLPYVHDTHQVPLLKAAGGAPKRPGYILGFKEMVLVDSKDPDAKPLPLRKMMVHHFLYWAPGRVDQLPGSCWPNAGFIGGRGEEHPLGRTLKSLPRRSRDRYGIANRMADGSAPDWRLTAMVMNHYKRPKSFYVRTKVWYTTEKRTSVSPVVIGDCAQLANGMSYDVPGGGRRGSNFVDSSEWLSPSVDAANTAGDRIRAAARWLQDNCHRAVSVNDAAEACAMSQRTLLRNFQTYIGASPSEYLQRVRLERACQLLAETSLPADKVARRVGLTNGDRLGKLFRRCMGKSPIEYRAWTRGNADANESTGETTVSAPQQLTLATCDE